MAREIPKSSPIQVLTSATCSIGRMGKLALAGKPNQEPDSCTHDSRGLFRLRCYAPSPCLRAEARFSRNNPIRSKLAENETSSSLQTPSEK